jgi:hypothetical protein
MTAKSIWWSVTAYEPEIALCEGTLPEFAKAIHGGRETCPTTGRLHFQGALQCYKQERMAKIKSWLKRAHLQPARSAEALKKYVMKEETAAGVKGVRENPLPHYSAHEICLLLAQTDIQTSKGFWPRAQILLRKTPEMAGQLMNPSLRGFFEKTQVVWMERAAIVLQQPTGTIEHVVERCDCGRDECETCYEQEQAAISAHDDKVLDWCEEMFDKSINGSIVSSSQSEEGSPKAPRGKASSQEGSDDEDGTPSSS